MTSIVIIDRRQSLPNARRALKGRYAAKNRDKRSEKEKSGEGRARTATEFAEFYPRGVHLKFYFK